VAGGGLPRRDAGKGGESGVDLSVEVEEGRKIDIELRNASKESDAGRDAVAEKRERGPAGETEDGGDGAGGLGGDGGGFPLAIRTSAGRASKNNAAVPLDGERRESVGRKDSSGGTRNRHFPRERDIPAEAKMRMVSWATRSAMRPSTKRPVSSM